MSAQDTVGMGAGKAGERPAGAAGGGEDTVWTTKTSLIDRIPQPIAMAMVLLGFIGSWQLVTMLGIVSPIILPTPWETFEDILFVG
ncbi:MAG: hypothetical protein AAFZ09_01795, partial [Pseudomonadota bacterium]